MSDTTLSNNNFSLSFLKNHFSNEIDIEQKTYNYYKKKHKSKKSKKNSAFISVAVSVTILASAQSLPNVYINESTTANSSNNLNDLDEGDVDMSNNKDTSTQEVRQKDLDSLKEIEETKINGLDDKFKHSEQNIKDIINNSENHINKRIDALNTRIDDLTKTMDRDLKIVAGVLTLAIAAATFIIKVL